MPYDGNETLEYDQDFLDEFLDQLENDYCPPTVFHQWQVAMLVCLMVFGLLVNGFILLRFFKLPRIRSFTYHFVASLALADLLMAILNPILILLLLYDKIDFEIGQLFQLIFEWFCAIASLTSFACISVDRMLAIAKPLYHRSLPRSRCIKVIIFVWCFSVVMTLLSVFLSVVVDFFLLVCCYFTISFAIPTLITLVSYAIIARTVVRRGRNFRATDHHANTRTRDALKITWKIFLVILPGIAMWTLYWVIVFLFFTDEENEDKFSLSFIQTISFIPIFTAVVNPLIFIIMTPEFRRYLLKFICRQNQIDLGRRMRRRIRSAQMTVTSV